MYYKSVIIHKDRVFPYFQNKVKKLNNIIKMIIIIIIIIIIRKIIIKKYKLIKDIYIYIYIYIYKRYMLL